MILVAINLFAAYALLLADGLTSCVDATAESERDG